MPLGALEGGFARKSETSTGRLGSSLARLKASRMFESCKCVSTDVLSLKEPYMNLRGSCLHFAL